MMIMKKPASRTRVEKYEMIKGRIGKGEDVALKTITDLVAYKIYQSPEDKGPMMNFITAESFVAQFVSEHFANVKAFDKRLKGLRQDVNALASFADDVYRYYCEHRPY